MNKTEPSAFKRLSIGTTFTSHLGKFRKVSGTKVIRVKPNGVGETHAKLSFPRNTRCTLV